MSKIGITIVFILVFGIFGIGQEICLESSNISPALQFLKMPKPSYTDNARQKNVKGWVRLKVTFLATGEIGDVIYVTESSKKKKLTKYGLTEQAIIAAKKIKFVPVKDENGKPIDVTKVVDYSFEIY